MRHGNSERETFWQGVIREQESSGVAISAFCRKRGVSQASFFSWRRKLADRDRGVAHESAVEPDRAVECGETAAKFVPIELPSPPAAARSCCEVVLPNGCRIIVPTQCDAGWLREILGALQEQSC